MTNGKDMYETFRSLTDQEREEFKLFLEQKGKGSFSDLLYEFVKSKRA